MALPTPVRSATCHVRLATSPAQSRASSASAVRTRSGPMIRRWGRKPTVAVACPASYSVAMAPATSPIASWRSAVTQSSRFDPKSLEAACRLAVVSSSSARSSWSWWMAM